MSNLIYIYIYNEILVAFYTFKFHIIIIIPFPPPQNRLTNLLTGVPYLLFVLDDADYSIGSEFCPNMCGRSYRGRYRFKNIKRHLRYECGVQPQFQCNVCLKRFTHNSDRKKHMVMIHKTVLDSRLH